MLFAIPLLTNSHKTFIKSFFHRAISLETSGTLHHMSGGVGATDEAHTFSLNLGCTLFCFIVQTFFFLFLSFPFFLLFFLFLSFFVFCFFKDKMKDRTRALPNPSPTPHYLMLFDLVVISFFLKSLKYLGKNC